MCVFFQVMLRKTDRELVPYMRIWNCLGPAVSGLFGSSQ